MSMTRTIIYINNLLTREGGHVNSYNKINLYNKNNDYEVTSNNTSIL